MKTTVHFKHDPLSEGLVTVFEEPMSISDMLTSVDAPDWFWQYGAVTLNGHLVPREMWKFVTPKGDAELRLTVVPQGDKVLPIVAGLALVALTAGIGAFGVPFLGAAFAGGTLGASAVATGVGLVGSLAINALTSPTIPKTKSSETEANQTLAGSNINSISPFAVLPVVTGKVRFPPPVISSSYTTFEKEVITVHAIVGFEGRCLVEDVEVNDTDITLLEGVDYELREGGLGDAPLTLAQLTCIQDTASITLSKHDTKFLSNNYDQVEDQINPDNSVPVFHHFNTKGSANEIWIRLLFPSGIIYAPTGAVSVVPIKIELRKKGDVDWRGCPILYIYDERKASGPLRVEVKLKFERMGDGPNYGYARLEYPIYAAKDENGLGKAWEYLADPYFHKGANPADNLPAFTSATTSGVTITTSSANGANVGWHACDGNFTTSAWEVLLVSLPAWIKWDFGVGNSRTYKSFMMGGASAGDNWAAAEGYLEGSNDDTNWTLLSTFSSDVVVQFRYGFIKSPAAYRYYRFTVTENLGAVTFFRMYNWEFYTDDVYTQRLNSGSSGAHYVSLNENGANIFLDPNDPTYPWDIGEYEVRVKRGIALVETNTDVDAPGADSYAGNVNATYWFSYLLSSGTYFVAVAQRDFRSDCVVEVFSTVSHDSPVDTSGICCIAIEAKHLVLNSITGLFTSYGHEYLGSNVWSDEATPTQNNAVLFRDVLLGYGNFIPVPGPVIDEDSLVNWFGRCVSEGHQINAVFQDRSIEDVLNTLAYTGMASVRNSHVLGVVEDYDRSAESVAHPISPMNAECLGQILDKPELPDALYVDFHDEDQDYKLKRLIVYRRGFDVNTARVFDTISYEGMTNETKVLARANFDLKQLEFRSVVYQYKMGLNGFIFEKGTLVRLSDYVIDEHRGCGIIQEIGLSGTDVVYVVVENTLPFGQAQGDVTAIEDFMSVTDVMDDTRPMGVCISVLSGEALVKAVTNVEDGNTCIFTTPFDYAASGLALGDFVSMGVLGNETRRAYVSGVEPLSLTERIVDLRDCADEELF